MATLSSLLRCLTRKSKSWSFVVCPDPRLYDGFSEQNTSCSYFINFQRNLDVHHSNAEYSPMSGGVYNGIPSTTSRAKIFSAEIPWVNIEYGSLQTNTSGLSLREALTNAMQRFPKYDLKSKRGIIAAIEDMEMMLKPISFEDQLKEEVQVGVKEIANSSGKAGLRIIHTTGKRFSSVA